MDVGLQACINSKLQAQTSRRGSTEQVLLMPLNKWPLPALNQRTVCGTLELHPPPVLLSVAAVCLSDMQTFRLT